MITTKKRHEEEEQFLKEEYPFSWAHAHQLYLINNNIIQ